MSMQRDGQAKCDKCGTLDGDTTNGNVLVKGWMRLGSNKHICPNCDYITLFCLDCEKEHIVHKEQATKKRIEEDTRCTCGSKNFEIRMKV